MCISPSRTLRILPVILGLAALGSVALLFAWDGFPQLFPDRAHDVLAAFPLTTIAFAYLVYQRGRRPARMEAVKAILLAIAFLFWAANQLWPDLRPATLFNDLAIGLFVLDVFLVMIDWPAAMAERGRPESGMEREGPLCGGMRTGRGAQDAIRYEPNCSCGGSSANRGTS